MGLVGFSTEFSLATSAQVMVFALLGVLVDNELAPPGVARFLASEAGISGQLVLSLNRVSLSVIHLLPGTRWQLSHHFVNGLVASTCTCICAPHVFFD